MGRRIEALIAKRVSPKGKMVAMTVRLPQEDVDSIKAITDATGITRQRFVAEAVRDGITAAKKLLEET